MSDGTHNRQKIKSAANIDANIKWQLSINVKKLQGHWPIEGDNGIVTDAVISLS